MNSEGPIENAERLSELLREGARVEVSLPQGFQKRVWEQIAFAEASPQSESLWRHFGAVLERLFAHPAVAVSYIVCVLLMGLTAGWMQAREKSENLNFHLSHQYVASVDPFQNPMR